MILKDRIAVITAAGSGMGRASALRMAQEGATVVVADLNEAAAKSTVDEIASQGGKAVPFQLDVSKVEQLRELFQMVEREFGILHVLYNHAGIPGPAGLEMCEEDWDRAVNVNMKSAFFATSYAVPLLRKAEGKASVIFTASTVGLVASPRSPLYSMSKGGVVLLAKSLATALAPQIRVNAICPGPVQTPMLSEFFGHVPGTDPADVAANFVNTFVPMQRTCRPEEIAEAALYLASDRSSYVTGIALPVDGGFTAK